VLAALVETLVNDGARYPEVSSEIERLYIAAVLRRYRGVQARAAQTLGMHRNSLMRKIAQYNLHGLCRRMMTRPYRRAA
jgi:DNA-binding NtrC family response regulator